MNFDFGETEKTLCEKINGLFDADSMAALANLENGDVNDIRDATMKWLMVLGQTGYLTPGLDDGKNNVGLTAIQESLAAISPSLYLTVEVTARIFGRLVAVYGTPDQKDEIIPPCRRDGL